MAAMKCIYQDYECKADLGTSRQHNLHSDLPTTDRKKRKIC